MRAGHGAAAPKARPYLGPRGGVEGSAPAQEAPLQSLRSPTAAPEPRRPRRAPGGFSADPESDASCKTGAAHLQDWSARASKQATGLGGLRGHHVSPLGRPCPARGPREGGRLKSPGKKRFWEAARISRPGPAAAEFGAGNQNSASFRVLQRASSGEEKHCEARGDSAGLKSFCCGWNSGAFDRDLRRCWLVCSATVL